MTRQNSRSLTTNRYEFLIICKKIHLKYVGLVHRRQEGREETQVRGTVSQLLTTTRHARLCRLQACTLTVP